MANLKFEKPIQKMPVKAISLALVLFLVGVVCLFVFVINFFNIYSINETKQNGSVLLSLALITLIPGAYHIRLAWLAYMKVPGYSYDQIASD